MSGQIQFPDISGGSVIQIFFQVFHLVIQQGKCFFLGNTPCLFHSAFYLLHLPALQICLEGQHLNGQAAAFIFQHPADGFSAFFQIQQFLISAQQIRKFPGPFNSVIPVPVQGGRENFNGYGLFIYCLDMFQRFLHFLTVSKTQHRKGNGFVLVFHGQQFFHHSVDGVIVIRHKQHGLFIEKGRDNGVDYGAGFSGSRRPLDIGNGIFHGVIDGQKLVQIHLLFCKYHRIRLSPAGSAHHFTKKCLNGGCHFLFLIHVCDSLIFFVQIQYNIHAQTNQVRHVIYAHSLSAVVCNTFLNLFLILLKLLQQFIFLPVQKFPHIFFYSVQGVFGADNNLIVRPQNPLLYIKLQLPVSQHIQSPGRGNAEYVYGKLLYFQLSFPVSLFRGFVLELFHNHTELVFIQQILFSPEALPVQIPYQFKIGIIRNRIHAVAQLQIIQYFQICRMFKQILVFTGIFFHIPYQLLIYGTIRTFHNGGRKNGVNINHFKGLSSVPAQMQTFHFHGALCRIQVIYPNPVS